MLLLLSALSRVVVNAQEEADERPVEAATADAEPDTAILFPWFTEALGIIVFFVSILFDYILIAV